MAKNELTIEQINDVVETIVQRELGTVKNEIGDLRPELHSEIVGLRTELRADINGAVDQIIGAFDRHMAESDTKFTSDRKRIERLEKIVLY